MARTIYVSGGRADLVSVWIVDKRDHDLAQATIQVGLSANRTTPPTTWYTPENINFPGDGTVWAELLVNSTRAPAGSYWVWAEVVESPASQPVPCENGELTTL